jgi:precorrin isomerase
VARLPAPGYSEVMKFSESIRRRIRHSRDGVNVVADVNAVVAGNVNEPGRKTSVSSRQTVVQRSGRTTTTTETKETRHDGREA